MKLELVKLDYAYNALAPMIDEQTMLIHHTKHHQGYVDKTNLILDKYDILQDKTIEDILFKIDSFQLDDVDKRGLINSGGGVINHNLFWEIMGPNKEIDDELVEEIKAKWGSLDKFKEEFGKIALSHFGSGWAWLVRDENKKLQIYTLPNQDSPYIKGHIPVFNLDLWEHAYYLNYQNRRAEYIENWWKVLKLI